MLRTLCSILLPVVCFAKFATTYMTLTLIAPRIECIEFTYIYFYVSIKGFHKNSS